MQTQIVFVFTALMRFSRERLEGLAVNAKVATVLGSIPSSSDTVESEGRQIKQC